MWHTGSGRRGRGDTSCAGGGWRPPAQPPPNRSSWPPTPALETFARLGALTWARQAEIELEASGAAIHHTTPAAASQLTPRELQICALVAQGATNPEIAEKLFLSRKTIEAHLGRIFAKLDVRSRTELTRLVIRNDLGERAA